MREIHLISNGKQSLESFSRVAQTVQAYVSYIHLREKHRTDEELLTWINELTKVGILKDKLIINDRVEVAVRMEVKGIQLTTHSEGVASVREAHPNLLIGQSVHSLEEAKKAEDEGANYIIFGHIYRTNSKPGLKPRGLEQLQKLVQSIEIPVIAIGGITPERVEGVMNCGAKGIAVMSGLIEAENPKEEVKCYLGGVL
ncbi:thiazole tautomerase TenI [Alkalibacillus silvisoli]|uniref:Thiazole tautomerase TenI n=1 Tax=Alkalibacillus silvisoli TaxID=392823 RepID=A0ABN0ZV30_9BACI